MSKKRFGKILAAVVLAGAAVAGCAAYFTKYRDFQKSLDEDFNDFEDDANDSSEENKEKEETEQKKEHSAAIKREYVSIPLDTPEPSDLS